VLPLQLHPMQCGGRHGRGRSMRRRCGARLDIQVARPGVGSEAARRRRRGARLYPQVAGLGVRAEPRLRCCRRDARRRARVRRVPPPGGVVLGMRRLRPFARSPVQEPHDAMRQERFQARGGARARLRRPRAAPWLSARRAAPVRARARTHTHTHTHTHRSGASVHTPQWRVSQGVHRAKKQQGLGSRFRVPAMQCL